MTCEYYQHRNWHNKWWVNIKCSFKITHAVNLLLQKIRLCSFTSLISQKFSETAVILAIAVSYWLQQCHIGYSSVILATAVSKRCTQDLPVVYTQQGTQGSSTGFLLPTIQPFQKNFFEEYFFCRIVDSGVPFSINFLSSSAFLGGVTKQSNAVTSNE